MSVLSDHIFNKLKKRAVHQRYFAFAGKERVSVNPENRIVTKDLLTHIQTEIENLPKQQRDIYMMNREDSLTYKEISDRLGVSPKTIQYQYMAENSIRFWAGLLSNFFA